MSSTHFVRLLSSPLLHPLPTHSALLNRPILPVYVGRNGFTNEAFRLAEQYHDYRSLAALCTKEVVYPPEMNPNGAMIQMYVEKFQDAFTDELFQWYIEHGTSSLLLLLPLPLIPLHSCHVSHL